MPKPQSKTGIPDYFCAASFAAGPLGNLLLPKHQFFRQRLFWLTMRIVPPSFANLHKPSRAALIARGFFCRFLNLAGLFFRERPIKPRVSTPSGSRG